MASVQEVHRERQPVVTPQLIARKIQGFQTVADSPDVGADDRIVFPPGFEAQKIDQGGPGAPDLAGQHRLLAHKAIDEPVERRHQVADQVQETQRFLGGPKPFTPRPIHGEGGINRRQRVRHERLHLLTCHPHPLIFSRDSLMGHCERNLS